MKQRRKRCVPKQSRKNHVDKARVRQATMKPHVNKYRDKTNGEK